MLKPEWIEDVASPGTKGLKIGFRGNENYPVVARGKSDWYLHNSQKPPNILCREEQVSVLNLPNCASGW